MLNILKSMKTEAVRNYGLSLHILTPIQDLVALVLARILNFSLCSGASQVVKLSLRPHLFRSLKKQIELLPLSTALYPNQVDSYQGVTIYSGFQECPFEVSCELLMFKRIRISLLIYKFFKKYFFYRLFIHTSLCQLLIC